MSRGFRYFGPPGPRMVRPHEHITVYTRAPAPAPRHHQQDYYQTYDSYSDETYQSYNDSNNGFSRTYYGAQHQEQLQVPATGQYVPLQYPPANDVIGYTVRPHRYPTSVTELQPDYSYTDPTNSSRSTLLALPAPPEESVTSEAANAQASVASIVYEHPAARQRFQHPQYSAAQSSGPQPPTQQYFRHGAPPRPTHQYQRA